MTTKEEALKGNDWITTEVDKHKFRLVTRKDKSQFVEIIRKGDLIPTLIGNLDHIIEEFVWLCDNNTVVEDVKNSTGL